MSERLGGPAQHHDPGTIRVGSLGGVDVLVLSSWFLIAALIAYLVAPAFEQVQPGLGSLKYVAGAAFAVLLTLSLLLHELSHALMSKRFGIPVRSITLHFIGGVTAMESEPASPKQEFAISANTSQDSGLRASACSLKRSPSSGRPSASIRPP